MPEQKWSPGKREKPTELVFTGAFGSANAGTTSIDAYFGNYKYGLSLAGADNNIRDKSATHSGKLGEYIVDVNRKHKLERNKEDSENIDKELAEAICPKSDCCNFVSINHVLYTGVFIAAVVILLGVMLLARSIPHGD